MIKALIFDAGGVIVSLEDQLDRITKILKPGNKAALVAAINVNLKPLQQGTISEADYWKKVFEASRVQGFGDPGSLWSRGYEETARVHDEVIELLAQLGKQYRLILISNTIKAHADINARRGVFDHFDDVLNSHEVHMTKDDPEIFKLALRRNSLRPDQCIFIDDEDEYVAVARQLGIQAIHFLGTEKLVKELSARGVAF